MLATVLANPLRSTCERLRSLSAYCLVGVDHCPFANLSVALAALLPSNSLARAMRRVFSLKCLSVFCLTIGRFSLCNDLYRF